MATPRRWALLLCLLASTGGCLLFTDPINTAPRVTLAAPSDAIVRGKTATFHATVVDDEQRTDDLAIDWYRGKTCDKALAEVPLATIGRADFTFVPGPSELGSACVVVVVTDKQGVKATDSVAYQVVDQAPIATIEIQPILGQPLPQPGYPFSLPLFSQVTMSGAQSKDPDDALLTCIWNVYFSDGSIVPLPSCPDKTRGDCVCTFVTAVPGHYRIELVVEDPSELASVANQVIDVDQDQPPKIIIDSAQPRPQTLPDAEPLLLFSNIDNSFTVHRVEDDGDPYPPAGLPPSEVAGFVWYIRDDPTSSFQRITHTGPCFTLVAGTFPAGKKVQVRAEYRDRVTACQPQTPDCEAAYASCNRDQPVCSSSGRAQWVTWTLEFR